MPEEAWIPFIQWAADYRNSSPVKRGPKRKKRKGVEQYATTAYEKRKFPISAFKQYSIGNLGTKAMAEIATMLKRGHLQVARLAGYIREQVALREIKKDVFKLAKVEIENRMGSQSDDANSEDPPTTWGQVASRYGFADEILKEWVRPYIQAQDTFKSKNARARRDHNAAVAEGVATGRFQTLEWQPPVLLVEFVSAIINKIDNISLGVKHSNTRFVQTFEAEDHDGTVKKITVCLLNATMQQAPSMLADIEVRGNLFAQDKPQGILDGKQGSEWDVMATRTDMDTHFETFQSMRKNKEAPFNTFAYTSAAQVPDMIGAMVQAVSGLFFFFLFILE